MSMKEKKKKQGQELKENGLRNEAQQEHFKHTLDQQTKTNTFVAKPKDLKNTSYAEALSTTVNSTVNSFLSYLPSTVSKSLPVTNEESTSPKIIWAHFQSIELKRKWSEKETQRHLYLILGYSDGVQIWDCSNLEEIKAILSIKCGPARCAKILENPIVEKKDDEEIVGLRPHLAIVTPDMSQKNSYLIKIYSLSNGDTVHLLRFKSEIFNIHSNGYLLVACARDQFFSFNSRNYGSLFHIGSCQPGPSSGSSIVALGSRWIAYSTAHPVSKSMKEIKDDHPTDEEKLTTQAVVEAAKGVAAGVASNLYYWGDKGLNAVSGYFGHEEKKKSVVAYSSSGHGTVTIRDINKSFSIIANFQCHDNPINEMAFNESGSLLATADGLGQEINVFQIIPQISDDIKKTYNHLYRLIRGNSLAVIESISFSTNSQWLSVCSARGTTHLFPIHPCGQNPTIYTHGGEDPALQEKTFKKKTVTVYSIDRIHQTPSLPLDQQEMSKLSISSFKTPISAKFLTHSEEITGNPENSLTVPCLIINPFANLTLATITPYVHSSISNNMEVKELKVKTELLYEWSLYRPPSLGEIKTKIQLGDPKAELIHVSASNSRWLSNIEVETYEPSEKPIWKNSMFIFKTYQPPKSSGNLAEAEAAVLSNETESDPSEEYLPSVQINFRSSIPIPHSNKQESEDMRSAFYGSLEYPSPPSGLIFEKEALHVSEYEKNEDGSFDENTSRRTRLGKNDSMNIGVMSIDDVDYMSDSSSEDEGFRKKENKSYNGDPYDLEEYDEETNGHEKNSRREDEDGKVGRVDSGDESYGSSRNYAGKNILQSPDGDNEVEGPTDASFFQSVKKTK